MDDTAAKRKAGTVNVKTKNQTAGRDVDDNYDPFAPKQKNSVKTPATMAPRSKGKANIITPADEEEGKEHEEYDDWVNKNNEIRNSITELPG